MTGLLVGERKILIWCLNIWPFATIWFSTLRTRHLCIRGILACLHFGSFLLRNGMKRAWWWLFYFTISTSLRASLVGLNSWWWWWWRLKIEMGRYEWLWWWMMKLKWMRWVNFDVFSKMKWICMGWNDFEMRRS